MTPLKNLWLNGSLWNQKWFFYYGIAVKNLLSTFIFKIVTIHQKIPQNTLSTTFQFWISNQNTLVTT